MRLEGRLDSMEKGMPPWLDKDSDSKDDKEDKPMADDKEEKKEEKKDDKDDMKLSDNDYSDVITSEYLSWMENTLKSAGVDTGAARNHFDALEKAQLGGFDNPDAVDGADYFAGQVRGRGQENGSPSTGAIPLATSGGKTPSGALGPATLSKGDYITPSVVSDADIEAAYEVYKAAAQEQQFRGNLEKQFSTRFTQESEEALNKSQQADFDARGPLAEIQKAIEGLGERIDNISTGSTTITKADGSPVEVPSTADMANMSWEEIHRLADSTIRGV